jgi:hypothetical protein
MSSEARLGLILSVALGVVGFALISGIRLVIPDAPTADEVVSAFREEGLEVGESYPLDEDEVWQAFEHPTGYETATRFRVPSLGKEAGGRVFTFDNEADLREMRAFYEGMGPEVTSHLYEHELILLQINGDMPKTQADRYGEVARGVT